MASCRQQHELNNLYLSMHQISEFLPIFHIFSLAQHSAIGRGLTMAIIMDNLPLNAFDSSKYLSKALTGLINPQLRLPSYSTITNKWLDECYEATKSKVNAILASQTYLNFIIDESSNIRRERESLIYASMSQSLVHFICNVQH
jgi:AAA+ ATPase superfamily predicted ATPase